MATYRDIVNKFNINHKVLEREKISITEFMLLLSLYTHSNVQGLLKKGFINPAYNTGEEISKYVQKDKDVYNISLNPEKKEELKAFIDLCFGNTKQYSHKEVEELAGVLIERFPKGLKPGTKQYWRSPVKEITNRLINFYGEYGYYPPEIIIQATDRYLKSHENNPKLQRILKYFIMKKVDIGWGSDLYNVINYHSEEDNEDSVGGIELAN